MKNILKGLVFLTFALGLNTTFAAQNIELTGGLQTTDVDVDGASTDAGIGLYGGALMFIPLGQGQLRTGGVLSFRSVELEDSGVTADISTINIDVPVTYLHQFNSQFSGFGGLKFGLNLSDDCELSGGGITIDCDADVESIYYALSLGGRVAINKQINVEFGFDLGLSDFGDDTEWKNSLVAGLSFKL